MKKRVLLTLVLTALLVVPSATAAESADLSSPLDVIESWVASVLDFFGGDDGPARGDRDLEIDEAEGGEDDPGLLDIGPWLDPHG